MFLLESFSVLQREWEIYIFFSILISPPKKYHSHKLIIAITLSDMSMEKVGGGDMEDKVQIEVLSIFMRRPSECSLFRKLHIII